MFKKLLQCPINFNTEQRICQNNKIPEKSLVWDKGNEELIIVYKYFKNNTKQEIKKIEMSLKIFYLKNIAKKCYFGAFLLLINSIHAIPQICS